MFSILIPTINRPEFIIRYIDYLELSNFQGELLIGDSSDIFEFNKTLNHIKDNTFSFKIIHQSHPNKMHYEVIRELLPYISMPFSLFMCDDDFIIVETLNKAIDFLNKNLDYSAVGGRGIMCYTSYNDNCFKINYLHKIDFNNILEDTSIERLHNLIHSKHNVIAYSISRTKDLILRWPISDLFDEKTLAIEILPCLTIPIQGKLFVLEDLFVIRTNHSKRIMLPSKFNMILDPKWNHAYKFTIQYLTNLTINLKQNQMNYDLVYKSVNDLVTKYFLRELSNAYNRLNKKNPKYNLQLLYKIKSLILYKSKVFLKKEISLKSVQNKNSRDYKNFNNVYKILTNKYI